MKLNAADFHIIQSALVIAAEVYRSDVARMRAEGHEPLARQFENQAKDASELALRIEQEA